MNYFMFIYHIGYFTDYNLFRQWIIGGCEFGIAGSPSIYSVTHWMTAIAAGVPINIPEAIQKEERAYFYLAKLIYQTADGNLLLQNDIRVRNDITDPAQINPGAAVAGAAPDNFWQAKSILGGLTIQQIIGEVN